MVWGKRGGRGASAKQTLLLIVVEVWGGGDWSRHKRGPCNRLPVGILTPTWKWDPGTGCRWGDWPPPEKGTLLPVAGGETDPHLKKGPCYRLPVGRMTPTWKGDPTTGCQWGDWPPPEKGALLPVTGSILTYQWARENIEKTNNTPSWRSEYSKTWSYKKTFSFL